jgi:hypothetical protein
LLAQQADGDLGDGQGIGGIDALLGGAPACEALPV